MNNLAYVPNLPPRLTGVVIAELLEALTGKKIKGIDHKPKSTLAAGANLNILWRWMKKEDIELGGVNALNIQSGKSERTVLALLWRFIQKYDLVEGDKGMVNTLLEWVKPRTDEHKVVNNFTGNWCDGVAFLALLNSIVPDAVDMASVNADNQEKNLQKAFDLFEQKLFVPQMLAVEDLKGRPDKSQVMTYVQAIKNAAEGYHAAAAAQATAQNQHKGRGDELFQEAVAKQTKACSDGEDKVVDLVEAFKEEIKECDGKMDTYATLKDKAMHGLDPIGEDFAGSRSLYGQAQDEYQQCDDKDMMKECDIRSDETVEQLAALKRKLEGQLEKVRLSNDYISAAVALLSLFITFLLRPEDPTHKC